MPSPIDSMSPVGECCLWSIERSQRNYSGMVRNVRTLVHGDMVTPGPKVLGNVHFIDTRGWKTGGCFTFLDLKTMKPLFGPRADSASLNLRNRWALTGVAPQPPVELRSPTGLPINSVLTK